MVTGEKAATWSDKEQQLLASTNRNALAGAPAAHAKRRPKANPVRQTGHTVQTNCKVHVADLYSRISDFPWSAFASFQRRHLRSWNLQAARSLALQLCPEQLTLRQLPLLSNYYHHAGVRSCERFALKDRQIAEKTTLEADLFELIVEGLNWLFHVRKARLAWSCQESACRYAVISALHLQCTEEHRSHTKTYVTPPQQKNLALVVCLKIWAWILLVPWDTTEHKCGHDNWPVI